MKYQDILPDVLAGKWVRDCDVRLWARMNSKGVWESQGLNKDWCPLRAEYEKDTWEVKPDEPEEIRIVIDSVDKSPRHTPAICAWVANGSVSVHQKYKLIPVDEEIGGFEEWNKKEEELSEYAKTIGDNRWTNTETSRHMQIIAVILQERKKAWNAGKLAERKEGQLHTGSFHDWAAAYADMIPGTKDYEFGQKVWDASRAWEFKG